MRASFAGKVLVGRGTAASFYPLFPRTLSTSHGNQSNRRSGFNPCQHPDIARQASESLAILKAKILKWEIINVAENGEFQRGVDF